ncbi:tyrosinase [Podospora appendiculata]|uniref:tyrosinase n=1 Tax=Podospora appendiculata TaxID=314037 RepID=A0AAE1CE31_9PEZI|nr:tyrosinase [Podospora appendiculata]
MQSESKEYVLIQGIEVPKGQPIPSRQEFTKWATETPETSIQVSLFIRALQKFYDVPYEKTLSFFQVAGIHGYPGDLAWDDSAPPAHQRGSKMIYCTHNLITFPTWHRPYMLLFEDLEFHSEADKKAWTDEAAKWRLPYWDWAIPSSKGSVPDLFKPASVNIRVPSAADGSLQKPENVSNPLYKYQLKWAKCSGTSRWGIKDGVPEEEWSNGINNYNSITDAINLHNWYGVNPDDDLLGRPASDLVYRLLRSVPEWKNFSSTGTNPVPDPDKLPHIPWEQWVSLEYLHNNLHGFIGGNVWADGIGHMQNVPSAAFDPIFYMHHANIDRLLALWQTVNPDSWFESDASPSATDKLTPFHHKFASGKVDYFNSDNVRDWTNFGYTYDVLERKPDETDEEYIKRINVYISTTYSSNTGDVLLGDQGKLFTGDLKVTDHTYDDYLIDVLYDR